MTVGIISFDNTRATLDATEVEKGIVRQYLTFRPEGFQFSKLYKTKRWDGYKTLYKDADASFPAGLTWDVAALLRRNGYDTVVNDTRGDPPPADPRLDKAELATNLEAHQQEAVTRARQATRGVIHHPVGSGKSVEIVGIVQELAVPTLVLVQRKVLLTQQTKQLIKFLPGVKGEIGMVGDGVWQTRAVTVATMQTIAGRLRRLETHKETLDWLRQWQAVLIDECHHLPAASYSMLLRNLPNAYWRFGLSATPHRSGKKEQELYVTGLTGPIISAYEPTEGIEMGRLVPADVFLVDIGGYPMSVKGKPKYDDEVEWGIVKNERRNESIVKLAERTKRRGQTVILTERIQHGEILRDRFLDEGHEEIK